MIMSGIRILVANLPTVVTEMLNQTIQQQPDLEWLGNLQESEEMAVTVVQADILILGVEDVYSLPESCFWFLGNQPNLKVLLLTPAGDEAIVYWRALHCYPMQVTSSLSLIESVRQIYHSTYFDRDGTQGCSRSDLEH
jgi:hypothetical protein